MPRRYSRMGIGGDGSTLNLDFTGGSLDSRVVLTRSANTATYINSSGYVTTAAQNVARFDYDPTTLAAKGLLIEGQGINLALYSESFTNVTYSNDNSSGTNPVVTSVSVTNPANGSNANQIVFSRGSSGFSRTTQGIVGVTSSVYTMSVWMRTVTGTSNVGLRLGGSAGLNCAVTTTWTRFTHTYTATSTDVNFQIMLWNSISGQTDLTATIYVWGAQLELGSAASSYIPTTTAQVTRNPDLALMTSTNFSSWFTGGTTGTFFVDWHGGVRGIASTVRSVISTSDQPTKHLHLQQVSAAGALKVADSGAAHSVSTANTITSGARTKGAYSFAYPGTGTTSTVNLCLNGGTVATSSALLFSVAPTWFVLGATSTTGTSLTDVNTVLNGSIRQIKYYPTALSNSQLQALTT